MTITLRPYQQEALDSIVASENNGVSKQLVVLPTGAGKTILFSHLPLIRKNTLPMLVLAHRGELLDQARNKIIASNPHLTVEIEQAERRAGKVDVVVASVATLGRNNTPRILEYPQDYFKSIVIDEAHHAAATTYRRIVDYFNSPFLLGVTATPQRSDNTRLTDVFEEIVYYKSIQDLIEDGYLCPLIGYRVKTNTDITTPAEERSQILRDFSSGAVKVLVNVGVLTEGFDEPSLETIIIAKPTRSTLLYTQIVGRGTRLYDGKPHCTIIDISDTTKGKKPIGLPSLLGLPPDFDLQGKSLTEVAKEFQELETYCPGEAVRVLNPDDIQLAYARINLFMPPPPNPIVQQYSKLVWAEVGENSFHLGLNNNEAMSIHQDALGRWSVALHDKHSKTAKVLGHVLDLREAFVRSDRWIQNNRAQSMNLIESDAPWRADSPTDSQKRVLKRMGVPLTADLTKGMASQLISRYYENNPKPKWLQNKIDYNKNRYR